MDRMIKDFFKKPLPELCAMGVNLKSSYLYTPGRWERRSDIGYGLSFNFKIQKSVDRPVVSHMDICPIFGLPRKPFFEFYVIRF